MKTLHCAISIFILLLFGPSLISSYFMRSKDSVLDDHVGGGGEHLGRDSGRHFRSLPLHFLGGRRRSSLRQKDLSQESLNFRRNNLHRFRRRNLLSSGLEARN